MVTSFRMEFFQTFMILYSIGAVFILTFMIGQILLVMRKVDKELFRARLFLNDSILQRTWIYISISGASFALNNMFKSIISFSPEGELLKLYHIVDLTQLFFLISFILTVKLWYGFVGSFTDKKTFTGKISF